MSLVAFIQKPLATLFVGVFLATVSFSSYRNISDWFYLQTDISNIFEASVNVPDFSAGQNPLVLYDRKIHQGFNGDWTVEVKILDGKNTVCRGGATNVTYDIDEKLDPSKITFDWFVGSDCSKTLKSGMYYLEVNYRLRIEGRPVRYMTIQSNIFRVL